MAFQFDDNVQPGAPQWQVVEREELDAAQTQPPASQEPPAGAECRRSPNGRAGAESAMVLGLLGLCPFDGGRDAAGSPAVGGWRAV